MTTNKTYLPLLIQGIKASSDLEQNRFVGFDGNYCGAGEKALGVVDVSTDKDQLCPYAAFGILLVIAGDTVAVGDAVTSDENGKAVTATANDKINGYSLDSGVAGQEIRILRGI